jgi:L-rhamnose isomerase/sugar isomerase
MLAGLRTQMGIDPDPLGAYARSGYAERIAAERVGGQQAGWGA